MPGKEPHQMFLIPYYRTVIRTPLSVKAAEEIVARDVEIQKGPYLYHFVFHDRRPRATFIGNVTDRGFRLRTYTTSSTGYGGGTSPLKIKGSFLPTVDGTDVIVRVVPSLFSFSFWGLWSGIWILLMAYVGSLREKLICLSISLVFFWAVSASFISFLFASRRNTSSGSRARLV
jgi:hypothetical protein